MKDGLAPTSSPDRRSNDFWTWFETAEVSEVDEPQDSAPRVDELPGFTITGSGSRRRPRGSLCRAILAQQKGRCLYCNHKIGAVIMRRRNPVVLRVNWDHFIPYAYGNTNQAANWVAACHVCNAIKSCRMFDTVADAQRFILARWAEKGYEVQPPLGWAVGNREK
jgi:5-methylcytosine-specific restriction endonuclease McrA